MISPEPTDLRIPFPIVPKARPRVDRGATHMPTKYETCKEQIAMLLAAHFARQPGWSTDVSYALTVWVRVDNASAGDVDNFLGTVMDAGNKIVWRDDRQVVQASVVKLLDRSSLRPRTIASGEFGDALGATVRITPMHSTGFEPKGPHRSAKPKAPKGRRPIVEAVGVVLYRPPSRTNRRTS